MMDGHLSELVIRYCAEEVERQRDTAIHVYHMVKAWAWATDKAQEFRYPRENQVISVGHLVKPSVNLPYTFRGCNVRVGNHFPPDWGDVERLMARWVDAVHDASLTADEAYKEFQLIHPFRDGNGRAGKILYNWIQGTLSKPLMPPDFFGCSNP